MRYQAVGEVSEQNAKDGKALDLTSIGRSLGGERKSWYAYALIDARDEPYLTMRYRFEIDDGGRCRSIARIERYYRGNLIPCCICARRGVP